MCLRPILRRSASKSPENQYLQRRMGCVHEWRPPGVRATVSRCLGTELGQNWARCRPSGGYRLKSGECRLRRKIILKQFRIFMRVLALIALSASILSPPLRAEPATKTPNLTPRDYPLSPLRRLVSKACPASESRAILSDISISPRTPCDGPPKVCVMSEFATFCSRLMRRVALSPLSRNESAHRGGSVGASGYEGA
jgi:hypothetical protein